MPSSDSATFGPRSLISVCGPEVGSTTSVDVRDSSAMRTKSLRIASPVSSSTMRVPVRPPARPVATTGTWSCLSARATLIPLPPASVRTSLARWRWPSWSVGTVRERSSAALRVTVMITVSLGASGDEPYEMMNCAAGDPPPLCRGPGLAAGCGRDERRPRDDARAIGDHDRPDPLARGDRKREDARHDDPLGERPVGRRRPADPPPRDGRNGREPPADGERRVRAAGVDDRHAPVAVEAEPEQRREIAVALRLGGRAEHDGGDTHPARPGKRGLGPPGAGGVAGLAADEAAEAPEQVVGRLDDAAVRERRAGHPRVTPDHGHA